MRHASTEAEVDDTFTAFLQKRAGALLIGTDALFNGHAEPALAICHLVPAICEFRQFVATGGLIGWLASTPDVFSRATSQPNCRSSE